MLPEVLRPEVLLPEVLPMPRPAVLRPEILLPEVLPMLPHVKSAAVSPWSSADDDEHVRRNPPNDSGMSAFNLLMLAMSTAVHLHVGHASSDIGVLVVSL